MKNNSIAGSFPKWFMQASAVRLCYATLLTFGCYTQLYLSFFVTTSNPATYLWIIVLLIVAMLIVWDARISRIPASFFIALSVLTTDYPPLLLLSCITCCVAYSCLWDRAYYLLCALFALPHVTVIAATRSLADSVFFLIMQIVATVISITIILTVKSLIEADEKQRTLEKGQFLIRSETQKQISKRIHDGVAHDLSLIIIKLRKMMVSERTPNLLQTDLDELYDNLGGTLSRLRILIRQLDSLDTSETDVSINATLGNIKEILSEYEVTIAVQPEVNFASLSPIFQQILHDTIGELAANANKYAQKETAVEFEFRLENDTLILTQTNAIFESLLPSAVSGGTGLLRVRYAAEQCGGFLHYQQLQNLWIVELGLPLTPPEVTNGSAHD